MIQTALDVPGKEYPFYVLEDLKNKFKMSKCPTTVWKMGDLKLYECPFTWITSDTKLLMEYLFMEENPINIFPGSRIDQPKWWLEAIRVVKTERSNNIKKANG